jgi:hypothetical protein
MVTGIAMVKDEADVIAETVGWMLEQVDHVLVADNGSEDGTRGICQALGAEVISDPEPGYYQAQKMTALARRAAADGAEWVVPFDADEVWYSPHGRVAEVLAPLEAAVAPALVYDHVATADDPDDSPVARMAYRRREPNPLHKVACRPALPVAIAQGNHGASYPRDEAEGLLIVRHFPYRSVEQFVSKVRNGAAAYAATTLPEHEGKHWRDDGELLAGGGPAALAEVFRTWFWSAAPADDPALVYDPVRGLCPA